MGEARFSIKAFMLNVVLWLPLMFFLWFYVAALLVMPVKLGVESLFGFLLDGSFDGIRRTSYLLEVGVILTLPEGRAVADLPINPMIYGYGLPLVSALVIATPLRGVQRTMQLVVVVLVVSLIKMWGVYWEALRVLAFELGEPGRVVVETLGLPDEMIALCYQFGYLVLPAIVPVTLWVLMNRAFIEGVVGARIEPSSPASGQ